jgi:hypothetical protein
MIPDRSKIPTPLRFGAAITAIAFLTSCVTQPIGRPEDVAAQKGSKPRVR